MKDLLYVKKKLALAPSLTVLTGAGISAESGVPTFRGPEGLWRSYKPEDLATPEAFRRDPTLVWEWYQWRRRLIATKDPNAAHSALAALEKACSDFTLITQNVDGLHRAAGSRNVIELHGDIWKIRCTACGRLAADRSLALPPLPKCPRCGALLRPHIVWFGEGIDPANLEASMKACRSCAFMLVIGTSAVVQPAASFASIAKATGALVVEVNPNPALGDCADISLMGPAAEIVPQLLDVG
ncbi:MAG: NAD-dependent deacetylase [Nitrospiria bacterium]